MSRYRSTDELFDLDGRVAIVTGAPGTVGEAVAEALAEQGAHVVATSRTAEDCDALARRLSDEYERAIAAPADVTIPEDVTALLDRVEEEFGRLDVLVNNAYAGEVAAFEEMTLRDFQEAVESGVGSMFLTTRTSLPLLRDGGGSVINVSSIYGVVAPDHGIYGETGLDSPVHYGVAKAGVIQFSRWVATRYGAEGIRSNALSPGGMYMPDLESREEYEEVFVPNYEGRTPLGRMGTPEDLKGAAVFLASDASQWVTGANLIVDGGWTAW